MMQTSFGEMSVVDTTIFHDRNITLHLISLFDTLKMSLVLYQTQSEEDDLPEEDDVEPALEQSGPGADSGVTEPELPLRQEEFVEIESEDNLLERKLIETKVAANQYCVADF